MNYAQWRDKKKKHLQLLLQLLAHCSCAKFLAEIVEGFPAPSPGKRLLGSIEPKLQAGIAAAEG
jgi:hypothetical protein